ncbi:MAG: cytochrome ubiquinol oxidase subunit I [Bryobacteraceae bacterium]|nr:cytochrome ubiquinol oxidase subunit I [Bryobacteraceae bacterium]
MDTALGIHRFHFAFTVTYHYLFPQLTMGLALLILIFKTLALRPGGDHFNRSARFWAKIFAINFVMGVVTGIPMEFQFGTNWSRFSEAAGGVIGQTLAMEGVYSFFLESTFLGLFLYGEKLLGRIGHWFAAFMVFLGAWLSGYFILATNAWMQYPVGHGIDADGRIYLESFWQVLLNPWLFWMYLHNMIGSVVTAAFVMASIGAYYLLSGKHPEQARTFVKTGVIAGFTASVLMLFPTGDGQGKMVARHQPIALAAMEGLFETQARAPIAILGQPDVERGKLDNPLTIPGVLSMLTYRRWSAEVRGLDAHPRDLWPDNIPLLFYSFHIMIGLGTIFIAVMSAAALLLWKGALYTSKAMLWTLALMLPFPYIANTAGWLTAELGRQPWLIYGVMRTSAGPSTQVSSGNALFTLIGFMGMYALLSILFLFLVHREIDHGPEPDPAPPREPAPEDEPAPLEEVA